MDEISAVGARLRASGGDLAGTLAASFDAFEVIRSAARGCQDRDPGLLPAFLLAAGAAVEGRKAVTAAPSLPRTHGARRPGAPPPGPDAGEVADALAALGELLGGRLSAAAAGTAAPGDQAACAAAAAAAAQICQLLTPVCDASAVR